MKVKLYINGLYNQLVETSSVSQQKDGSAALNPTFNKTTASTQNVAAKDLMKYSIDGQKVLALHGNKGGSVQPVVSVIMFGILPVPQLNPSTDSTNFQNTRAYYSCFPYSSKCHGTNDDVVFFYGRNALRYEELQVLGVPSYGN